MLSLITSQLKLHSIDPTKRLIDEQVVYFYAIGDPGSEFWEKEVVLQIGLVYLYYITGRYRDFTKVYHNPLEIYYKSRRIFKGDEKFCYFLTSEL